MVSDEVLPTIFVKGVSQEQLEDTEERQAIVDDLSSFVVSVMGLEVDDDGKVYLDLSKIYDRLKVNSPDIFSPEFEVNSLADSQTLQTLYATLVSDLGEQYTSNFDRFVTANELQFVQIELSQLIDAILTYYSENKDRIDTELSRSLDFTYKVTDTYSDGGGKIMQFFEDTSNIIDCNYIN